MGRRTANKYIRKFGRGMLTPLKPLELQKSIPYIVVGHMTKQICPKSIIQKMLSVEIFKKSSYKWRLARRKCPVSRWDFSLKSKHFIVPTLQLHKILANTATKANLINTFSPKSSCSLERSCNSRFMSSIYCVTFSSKLKVEIHAEKPKGGSCRLNMTFSNIEDGSLEVQKVQEWAT